MEEKSKNLFNLIRGNVYYFESKFGVHPNIIKLSPDIMQLLNADLVLYLGTNDTLFGISLEVDSNKKYYIKVGYIE